MFKKGEQSSKSARLAFSVIRMYIAAIEANVEHYKKRMLKRTAKQDEALNNPAESCQQLDAGSFASPETVEKIVSELRNYLTAERN